MSTLLEKKCDIYESRQRIGRRAHMQVGPKHLTSFALRKVPPTSCMHGNFHFLSLNFFFSIFMSLNYQTDAMTDQEVQSSQSQL